MVKMDKKWVILCSTAVAAVYSAGYYTTESQTAANNQPIHQIAKKVQARSYTFNSSKAVSGQTNNNSSFDIVASNSQTNSGASDDSTTNNASTDTAVSDGQTNSSASDDTTTNNASTDTAASSDQTNSNTANGTASGNTQKNSTYKNGTFTGQGMNRRGTIQVQVTINKDKITDVQISDWGMHYSENDVVGLPDEVLKNQSIQVTNVSGATYSTQAFEDAVQDALNQAQNAG